MTAIVKRTPDGYSARQARGSIVARPRLHRLFFWLCDGQYDFRDDDSALARIANRIDPDWERQATIIENPGRWLICAIRGHESDADACGIPSHDYCLICGRSTPFAEAVS